MFISGFHFFFFFFFGGGGGDSRWSIFHERSATHCVHTHHLANVLYVCPCLQPFLILVIRWATDTQYITIHKISWTVKMVSTLQKLSWGFLHAVDVMTHSGILDHYRSFLDPFCFCIAPPINTFKINQTATLLYSVYIWMVVDIFQRCIYLSLLLAHTSGSLPLEQPWTILTHSSGVESQQSTQNREQ